MSEGVIVHYCIMMRCDYFFIEQVCREDLMRGRVCFKIIKYDKCIFYSIFTRNGAVFANEYYCNCFLGWKKILNLIFPKIQDFR